MTRLRTLWSLAVVAGGLAAVPMLSAVATPINPMSKSKIEANGPLQLVRNGGAGPGRGAMIGGRTGVGPSGPIGNGGRGGKGGWSGNPNPGGPGMRPGRGGGRHAHVGGWNGGRGHHRGYRNRYFVGVPYYYNDYYDDDYVEYRSYGGGGGGGDEECAARYRSYDPATGTFLGYDGLRHRCPYLD